MIKKVWVVTDPTPHSTMIDIVHQTDTHHGLPAFTIGGGLTRWKEENTALYLSERSAKADAMRRMKARKPR